MGLILPVTLMDKGAYGPNADASLAPKGETCQKVTVKANFRHVFSALG